MDLVGFRRHHGIRRCNGAEERWVRTVAVALAGPGVSHMVSAMGLRPAGPGRLGSLAVAAATALTALAV